jgi:uncharacterized protein (DUF2249 family)
VPDPASTPPPTTPPTTTPSYTPLETVTGVLIDALRALGAAGRPEQASRLAARAYVSLRRHEPSHARQINAAMHHIAPTPDIPEQTMTTATPQLDVRAEPPARRHELIFDTYDRLAPGDAFVLVNDHDPKPLYYQFDAEHPGEFSWEYLESGPAVWRVRIGRLEDRAQAL